MEINLENYRKPDNIVRKKSEINENVEFVSKERSDLNEKYNKLLKKIFVRPGELLRLKYEIEQKTQIINNLIDYDKFLTDIKNSEL